MRDYLCNMPDGRHLPVSQFTDQDIHECLNDGFKHEPGYALPSDIRFRLEIELIIRRLRLREKI